MLFSAVATVTPQPLMPRFFSLLVSIVASALVAVIAGATLADPIAVGRRLVHPDGVFIELQSIDFRDASIVLAATITNPGGRGIRLNRGRSLVLDDGAHGMHYLSPPADNPELLIPARTQLVGELVFVGPLASAAHSLNLSSNRGIGTADNPYDDAPVFEAALPMNGRGGGSVGTAASHPDGASLLVRRVVATPAACLVSLLATNGNDRTIVLNENGGLVLTDDQGEAAPLKPPTENRELVVPPGARLDADLLFDCHRVNPAGPLTLITNRGTAGTPDNPYDALPVFTLKLPVEHSDAALPEISRASVAPVARSHLSEVTAPVAAATAPPAPSGTPRTTSSAALPPSPPPPPSAGAAPNSAAPALRAPPPAPTRQAPMSLAQLEAALRAEKTDRGLRLVLPADALFQSKEGDLDNEAVTPLTTLAELAAAFKPREILVIGYTDSVGDDAANLALSKQRAHAVAAWLAAHDSKDRPHFIEEGYGRTRPVAPNHQADGSDNPEGRAANRRIEILLRRH